MKRFFFTVIALSSVAVGCTKSGLMESPQTYKEPISFEPYTGKAPVTKATIAYDSDLQTSGFRVIGFKDGAEGITTASPELKKWVSYNSGVEDGKNPWSYTGAMYWPDEGTLSFVAYGLNANGVTSSSSLTADGDITAAPNDIFKMSEGNDYTSFVYSVPDNVDEQKDLVISPMLPKMNGGKVSLRFYHVLSRIGFSLKTTGTDDINVIIKNIRFTGTAATTATFNLQNAVTLTETGEGENKTTTVNYSRRLGNATSINYSLFDSEYTKGTNDSNKYPSFIAQSKSNSNAVTISNNYEFTATNFNPGDVESIPPVNQPESADNKLNRYMMIMPGEVTNPTIEVIYQLEDGDDMVATVELGDQYNFAAGTGYEFVFTVSTTAVGFSVKVDKWNPTTGEGDSAVTTPIEEEFPLTPAV